MSNDRCHKSIVESTLKVLALQPEIPSRLVEVVRGQECLCAGAAILYVTRKIKQPSLTIQEFAEAACRVEEREFV
jgi:hypothetical protein